MDHPNPISKPDESIADILILSMLAFMVVTCIVLVGIF
jgi:hypothetical protein